MFFTNKSSLRDSLQPIILHSDNTSTLISASNTFIQTHSLSSFKVKVLHDFIDWMQYRMQYRMQSVYEPTDTNSPAHLAVEVGHRVGLNEPPSSTADERSCTRSDTCAVVRQRLLVLGVRTLRHPKTETTRGADETKDLTP